jgi:hypothetical protein
MAYDPNLYMPYGRQGFPQQGFQQPMAGFQQPAWVQPNQMQQPYDARVRVNGRNGADAYWMPPDSHAILLDEGEDILYYKTTDSAGYPSVREFDLVPRTGKPKGEPPADYVTRADFDALAAKVEALAAPKTARARKAAENGE